MVDQGHDGLLSPFLRARRTGAARPYLKGRTLDVGCGSGALAALVEPTRYVGFDIDQESLTVAHRQHPEHDFRQSLPDQAERFDTITALAVIEHVPSPAAFLKTLAGYLRDDESTIICTTPHPAIDKLHWAGAQIGVFSRAANDEHETLLDRKALDATGAEAGLRLAHYERFLMGGNQLALYRRRSISPGDRTTL